RNIIIAVIVIIIVVLGGWWLLSNQGGAGTGTGEQATSTMSTTTSQTGGTGSAGSSTTLKAVTAQGGNYTCSLYTMTTAGQTRGTIYGSGGKTRLDLTYQSNDGTSVVTHIIRNGTTSYTWVDGQTMGFKSAITASSPVVSQPQGGVISDDSSVSSDCRPWVPDATQFTPPTAISFVAQS
ncbi:MAG TPA: hypothetical protein VG753_02215, partial [Candidatus Paceibacterota bacterium]|nr:hypothetical protein [Candidatus Paceibacterota bacterium]